MRFIQLARLAPAKSLSETITESLFPLHCCKKIDQTIRHLKNFHPVAVPFRVHKKMLLWIFMNVYVYIQSSTLDIIKVAESTN